MEGATEIIWNYSNIAVLTEQLPWIYGPKETQEKNSDVL